jgi:hypothetical protein
MQVVKPLLHCASSLTTQGLCQGLRHLVLCVWQGWRCAASMDPAQHESWLYICVNGQGVGCGVVLL